MMEMREGLGNYFEVEGIDGNFELEDYNLDYVLKNEWDPPAGITRSLWEMSPDGRCVLREATVERKNEVPARKQWESRLRLKFKMNEKIARLMSYMVNYIASGLSMEIRRFWEEWIEKEGIEKVWRETRRMFWAVYQERIKPPVVEEPVGDCDCVHQKVVSRKELNIQKLSTQRMWVPLPLREEREKGEWKLSRGYLLRIKQLRRFSRSLLELKLLKKLFYLKSQILQAQIKQLREKVKTEKDPVQRKRIKRILQRKEKIIIPYWEERILWRIMKERQERLYAETKRTHPKIRKACKEIMRLAVEGKIEELKDRIVKFCQAYKRVRGRVPVCFYRALYLSYWIKKLQLMMRM